MEISGLPLHVLVVHGAVVLTPLAAVASILLAVVPRWRYLTRWPAVALALAATATVWVARISGDEFFESRFDGLPADSGLRRAIVEHRDRGVTLSLLALVFVALTVLGGVLLGGESGLTSGRGAKPVRQRWVELALPAAMVVASVLVLVYAVLTGDAGARATWDPPA